ncbi:unnamed protein product [Ectocarpus sp. 12 AP-2014]
MAEGFTAADYVTSLPLVEVQGKRLWLLRVPRHIDTSRLEGVKVKLPRKGREGKVLGRANKRNDSEDRDSDEEDGNRDCEDLALRAGDVAETHGFRALFSAQEDGALAAAPPFVGQLNVSVDMPDVDTSVADGDPRVETFVEPYQGRPQLKGMRVRYKPAGAGSEYSPSRPLAGREQPKGRQDHEDGATPATPDQGKKAKKASAANSRGAAAAQAAEVSAETPKSSKKKKRKSTTGGGHAEEEGHGESSTKKSKKKKGVER